MTVIPPSQETGRKLNKEFHGKSSPGHLVSSLQLSPNPFASPPPSSGDFQHGLGNARALWGDEKGSWREAVIRTFHLPSPSSPSKRVRRRLLKSSDPPEQPPPPLAGVDRDSRGQEGGRMFAQPSNDLAGHKREKAAPGEFKLKLHGVENVQISSEAHKKKAR